MGSSFGLCVIMGLPSFSLLVLFVAVTHGLDVSSEIERDVETAEYIKVCEAGYFCDWKNFFKKKICPKGHFCPKNSFKPTPCPLSTYASEVGLKAESECKTCPPGHYCVGFGLTKPSGPCNAGYFCPSGSIHPDEEDCAKGSYCPEGTAKPIECPAGTYQPYTRVKSLSSCKPCPAGKFCGKPGLSAPDGFCSAGQFCPTGSTKATPCPAGTYQPMARQSSCDACMEGEFCAGQGLPLPTGPCQPGFFCPAGSRKADEKECPKGTYCPTGSPLPIYCGAGTYQPKTRATELSDCMACDPGKYCSMSGLAAPDGPCKRHYYCPGGNMSPNPPQFLCPEGHFCGEGTATPVPCPKGHFCIEGTWQPPQCPIGTYQPHEGMNLCYRCPAGSYCAATGLADPSGHCAAGYYCPAGSTTANPAKGICPAGHFCPEGSAVPTICPAKWCQPNSGSMKCLTCPEGYECPEGCIEPKPIATKRPTRRPTEAPTEAPLTTAIPTTTTTSICNSSPATEPTAAPTAAPSAAPTAALSKPPTSNPGTQKPATAGTQKPAAEEAEAYIAICPAGYYCSPKHFMKKKICPKGNYCPKNSFSPKPCPIRTYLPFEGGDDEASCLVCPAGKYCATVGSANPTGYCRAGYYCPSGSSQPNVVICTLGHYCVQGSAIPAPCPAGTYGDKLGLASISSCIRCPFGYECPAGSVKPIARPTGRPTTRGPARRTTPGRG